MTAAESTAPSSESAAMPSESAALPSESPAALPTWLRGILACPVCHAPLVDGTSPDGHAELVCAHDCDAPGIRRAYHLVDGTPVLLKDQARIVGEPHPESTH